MRSATTQAGQSAIPVRKVTVVAVDERPEVRIGFENDLVRFLQARGVDGSASHENFSFSDMQGDRSLIQQRLQAAGIGSALFIRVTDRLDYVDRVPVRLGSMDMAAVDESRYNAFTNPGGDMNTGLRLGVRLYRVSDGAVIWSGLVSSTLKDGEDPIPFLRNLAKAIADQMAKDKVIP